MENKNQTNIDIGKKIRALRKIRGISLQELSKGTDMIYSYLSGLENGKHSISITNLQRLADYFKINMIHFMIPDGPTPNLFRRKNLFKKSSGSDNIIYQVVTSEDSSNLQMSYVYMPPNQPKEHHIHKHDKGQELIIALSGQVSVMVGETPYQLGQGDSLIFDSKSEHFIYTEEEPATIVIISSPPYTQNLS